MSQGLSNRSPPITRPCCSASWSVMHRSKMSSTASLRSMARPARSIASVHLVPFGEYFPVPDFVREWMRMMSLPYSDISRRRSQAAPDSTMPDGNRLAVAICYEDAYAAEQLYALPDATMLINVSNDAWFGDSIAPHQHLRDRTDACARGRSIRRPRNEQRRQCLHRPRRLAPRFRSAVRVRHPDPRYLSRSVAARRTSALATGRSSRFHWRSRRGSAGAADQGRKS